jgi:hypothetical protein
MLLRLGRRDEAEQIMETIHAPPQAALVPTSVPNVASISAANNDEEDTYSSDDGQGVAIYNYLKSVYVNGEEAELETEETEQDDNSGGDPRTKQQIAIAQV